MAVLDLDRRHDRTECRNARESLDDPIGYAFYSPHQWRIAEEGEVFLSRVRTSQVEWECVKSHPFQPTSRPDIIETSKPADSTGAHSDIVAVRRCCGVHHPPFLGYARRSTTRRAKFSEPAADGTLACILAYPRIGEACHHSQPSDRSSSNSSRASSMSEQPRTPKRRLWLDATRAESEGESSTVAAQAGASSVPAPPIPDPPRQRTHSPTPSAPEPKRRTGFGHYGRARRRNHKQRESPDPMLGLIDSLSTISRPPSDEFDAPPEVNGTVSAPVILRVRPVRSYGGGAESIASEGYASDFTKSLREEFANIDDAAEPPVIRMSKRPSGFSELTAPKPGPREHNSLRAYLRSSRSRSAISLTSNDDDAKSIGTISIENGHRRSIPGTERQSLESRASAKRGHHSLIAMSSRERLKGKEADRRRETISPDSAAIRMSAFEPDSTASTSPRHVFALDDPIKEEELTPPPAPASIPNSVASSSKKEGKKPKLVDDVSISSPLGGPAVPSRRSSLKMQDMPTPQRRGPHSRQSSGQHATVLKEEEEPEPEPQPQLGPATVEPKVNLADVLDGEDTEVTKRIKELKAKKEQREREAGQSPKIEPEPPNGKRYGPMATPGPSALSPHVSNARLEASGSGAKSRRKFEGAIDVPPRLSLKDTSKPVNGDEHLTSEKDSDPDQPGTPLTPTPLPINYSYVVKSLNRDSSPSSKVSENTRPSTAGREKGKSRSLIVGSRTSSARAHATRSLNIDTSGRKRSDSSPARPVNGVERPPPAQAPATGSPIASERTSLQTESTAPDLQQPTSKPKKSSSVKKKRISHPDLPASMDRTVNKKSDSLAVRPPNPPETVQEERPGTADSIDHQVNVFIRSPRLTQKIQHPQTGRIISFSEVGDPKGHAVFCCVGMGLTRYVTAFYDELASTLRLRLITPDRPGVGESPVDPLGTPLSWPGTNILSPS